MALDEIFDVDRTRARSLRRAPDAASLAGGMDAVVGRPRRPRKVAESGQDVPRLVAMTAAAAADRVPSAARPVPSSTRRRPRRVDWLTVASGTAAVVAVALASTFSVVQIANASPVGDALVLLTSDQEALDAAEQSLDASRTRVEEQITTGVAEAAGLQSSLANLVPDVEDEESPFVDAEALVAVSTAGDAYQAQLLASALPEPLPSWTPPSVDDDSLPSVAVAIDEVQQRSTLVDEAVSGVREVRIAVDAAGDTFTAALGTFAQAIGTSAAAEIEDAPDVVQSLRDEVQAAAALVATTDLTTADGAAVLAEYRDSVRALRDEQLRVTREVEPVRQQSRPNRNTNNNGSGTEEVVPTDPGTGDTGGETPVNPNPGTDPGDGTGSEPGDGSGG